MVFVEAVRSKEATEIVRVLWRYISIFGPPKVILSDQGKEFVNHLVDSLLRRVGCEHRITSAYNPRTNGQTERANQTICEALRKHTETEPNVWDKWLPFVCLAYNTRIHSVTGNTPFELLFGNKMNGFEDWTITNSNLSDIELIKKAEEIANLGSNIRQKALVNIKEGQVAQRQIFKGLFKTTAYLQVIKP
jgi:hypothetical protein